MTSLRSRFYSLFALVLVASSLVLAQAPTPDVTTWHNNINRTGWQSVENVLTAATGACGSVNQTSFGLLWQWAVPGGVAAQPLAVSNLPTVGTCGSPCSLVFIATETNVLYAFNAGSDSQTPVWSRDLSAVAGGTYVDCTGSGATLAICQPAPDSGTLGVTGTPVIDSTGRILYAVGVISKSTGVEYDLFAVNILSGTVAGWVSISGSVTGKAPGTNCATSYPNTGTVSFDPSNSRQRGALLLLNGNMVYIPIAPAGPSESLNGWIFGYKFVAGTGIFTQVEVFNTTPYGTGGGVWESAAGLSAEVRQDGTTYLYGTTGNGTFDITGVNPIANDLGDSAIKLAANNTSGALNVVDYYTPFNVLTYSGSHGTSLCVNDADFGSGGVLVFPEAFYHDLNHNSYPNLSVNGDKQSSLYVLNRDSMGHYVAAGGNLIELSQVRNTGIASQGFWSTPAYWKYMNGSTPHYLLYSAVTSSDKTVAPYPMDMYELAQSGSSGPIPGAPTHDTGTILFCKYSPTPVVSSNGTTASTGIMWAFERQNSSNPLRCDGTPGPGALHAFNATSMAEIYTSRSLTTNVGTALSFVSPTVFASRVYVGTLTNVSVFGLCATAPSGVCKP